MGGPKMKRVLLVEDHSAFARALSLVLERMSDMKITALADTLAEGRELASGSESFDLAILDIMLPDGKGTELISELKERHPEMLVAVLSAQDDLNVALEMGADQAINKESSLPEIVSSLNQLFV